MENLIDRITQNPEICHEDVLMNWGLAVRSWIVIKPIQIDIFSYI